MARASRRGLVLFAAVALVACTWFSAAAWFQSESALWTALSGLILLGLVLVWGRRGPKAGWGALAVALLIGAVWWATIRPSNDRDWAPDVAHGVTAEWSGREVVVHNIRAFDWRTETEATERWETQRYDLDTLTSLDLVTSVWDSPAIAHTLLSFGFADGRRLVFSAEIRRERTETFSAFGGFFRRFELVLIAAEEADIIRLRTTVRKEQVSLYPLRAKPARLKELFLLYLARGNALARTPEFYNTLTTNCTTIVFDLARLMVPGLPMDWRILLSGYFPDYLYEHGAIRSDLPLDELKRAAAISAPEQPAGTDFSAAIRSGPLYRPHKPASPGG